jgi:hypothetical protein
MKPTPTESIVSRREGIESALRRAALEARELAMRTQTPLFVLREGRVINLYNVKPAAP